LIVDEKTKKLGIFKGPNLESETAALSRQTFKTKKEIQKNFYQVF